MCNACGFVCCAYDGFAKCGCDHCHNPACWTDDEDDFDVDDGGDPPWLAAGRVLAGLSGLIVQLSAPISLAAVVGAVVLLAGCREPKREGSVLDRPPSPEWTHVGQASLTEILKACDGDRAVYVSIGFQQGGVAVVPNAAECQ